MGQSTVKGMKKKLRVKWADRTARDYPSARGNRGWETLERMARP